MNQEDSLFHLVEVLMQKAPAYLTLFAAESDEEFEKAFDAILEHAISHLEKNSKNFVPLDEPGLTGALAAALSMPGLTVIQEGHSNGHADLTIQLDYCTPMRRKLAEAKIYDGPAYHIAGLGQLLSRYTTGREGRGLLISYVRNKDIAALMKAVRKRMDSDHPCEQQGETEDHVLKWSFLSTHAHSCGENLQVSHIGCNLFVEGAIAGMGKKNGQEAD